MFSCIYIYTYIYIFIYVYLYICIYIFIYNIEIFLCIHIFLYIHSFVIFYMYLTSFANIQRGPLRSGQGAVHLLLLCKTLFQSVPDWTQLDTRYAAWRRRHIFLCESGLMAPARGLSALRSPRNGSIWYIQNIQNIWKLPILHKY